MAENVGIMAVKFEMCIRDSLTRQQNLASGLASRIETATETRRERVFYCRMHAHI